MIDIPQPKGVSEMPNVTQPPDDKTPDPQAATPYFRRECDLAAVRRGLTPKHWAA